MKGSLTVEAAYIFPFCFLVLGIVCALGVFRYNQAVLKMTGYECILQTMEERNRPEETFRERLMEEAARSAGGRTLGVRDLEVQVRITASKISVSYRGIQTMLNLPLEVTSVCERTFPEMTLRLTQEKTGE